MKKKLGIVSVLCVVLAMMFTLTGCNAQGSVKKNFENEGYTVKTLSFKDEDVEQMDAASKTIVAAAKANMSDEQKKDAEKWEVIIATKGTLGLGAVPVVVIAFPGAGDLKDYLTVEKEDGTKDTSAYDKAKEDKVIRGNCLLLSGDKDIFNK